jgi:hypothetical protein
MNEQQQIVELLKEQNQLLKRHLWRFRFSLLALLLLTTATAIGLGFLVYKPQSTPANTFTSRKTIGISSDGENVYLLEQKVSAADEILEQRVIDW